MGKYGTGVMKRDNGQDGKGNTWVRVYTLNDMKFRMNVFKQVNTIHSIVYHNKQHFYKYNKFITTQSFMPYI